MNNKKLPKVGDKVLITHLPTNLYYKLPNETDVISHVLHDPFTNRHYILLEGDTVEYLWPSTLTIIS